MLQNINTGLKLSVIYCDAPCIILCGQIITAGVHECHERVSVLRSVKTLTRVRIRQSSRREEGDQCSSVQLHRVPLGVDGRRGCGRAAIIEEARGEVIKVVTQTVPFSCKLLGRQ